MNLKGLTVCVEFDDLLRLTLARNARHFEHLVVITSPHDRPTLEAVEEVTGEHGLDNVDVYVTNAFYKRGAVFNKGMCIEHGLDVVGRSGWLLVWDIDVVMPDAMDLSAIEPGKLYCPYRRMCRDIKQYTGQTDWSRWPVQKETEPAGYFQLFHAEDPVLKGRPWFAIDWRHAGGYDTDFQARWPKQRKVRLPFEVLHLGESYLNWHGRVQPRADGAVLPNADKRQRAQKKMYAQRPKWGFQKEKLK
ncbi:MAG: hypothetical protein ABIK89_15215 [Planctomycetota bacterium]